MSRWFTFARACWISVFSTEQCPLKSCQKVPTVSRVRVAVQVLMSTRWDWTKSPACDERAALMKLKGQRLELNTVNQGDMMRAVMHTRSTRSRASRRQQAGQSCHGLKKPLRPSEVFFSSLQFSSSWISTSSRRVGVPLFKAFEGKIYFLWLMQHPKYTHTTTLYFHHFILCQFIISTESTITMSTWDHPRFVTNKLHNSLFSYQLHISSQA